MCIRDSVKTIARGTPGFSGADLANLVNEAALTAARKDRRMVTHRDFEDAKDKVLMGSERRSMAMNEEEKRLTAYHEAGHAIVAEIAPHSSETYAEIERLVGHEEIEQLYALLDQVVQRLGAADGSQAEE